MRITPAPLLAVTALAAPLSAATPAAPVSALVRQVAIPHSSFRLANGLTVIVHEDHKAPVVAVSTWYNVGSKDEPTGKTGFAHLYEHLMFNGSENLPGDYFKYLQQIGATDLNGTTWFDRTNYYETAPAGALERVLFMESDRMGHLLGAVTQSVLDNQRSVVQNEKRQRDSAPGGLAEPAQYEELFPVGHPYHHFVIGSMADLDAASLADVKQWFRDKYGPNNAVLVVAGDTTSAQVRPLVEKYFGAVPRGPVNHPAMAGVPVLAAPKTVALKDALAFTIVQRSWGVPGLLSPQMASLDVGSAIVGALASSRLKRTLVRDEKLAIQASAGYSPLQRAGIFETQVVVRPGGDVNAVAARADAILADFIAKGPTADEVQRAVTTEVANRIRALEQVGDSGGKAVTLAEGQTFAGDSDFYRHTLAAYAAVTPASVRTVMQQWLTKPALTISISPGQRDPYAETKVAVVTKPAAAAAPPKPTRTIPPVGTLGRLAWPAISRTTLSNGVAVVYAQRGAVPLTQLAVSFDAGNAADPADKRGLSRLTAGLLEEGAGGRSSQQIAEEEERLGVEIGAGNTADRTTVSMSALSPNLAASLDLLADIVQRPTFNPGDVERVRTQALTGIAQTLKDPQRVALRVLPVVLWGAAHPYGGASGGDPIAIARLTREDLAGFAQRWLRPENAKLFVVSDRPLAEIKPLLEARFGSWTAPTVTRGVKLFPVAAARPATSRILLVDRPGAPQSTILGAQLLPVDPRSDTVPLNTANDVLGGNFLSRLNMDLRETRGWSYGVGGGPQLLANSVAYGIYAPVQADKTGESLTAMNADIVDFLSTKGVTPEELQLTLANSINGLPGEFETGAAVLQGMMQSDLLGRSDDYYVGLPARFRAQTPTGVDRAMRAALDPKGFTWVVVGDAAKLRPQLEKTGLPIKVVEAR